MSFHELPEKPSEEWTENEIREIFLDLFFWVAENRPSWLQEAINRRRAQLEERKQRKS